MLKASHNRFKRRYNPDGTVIQLLEDETNDSPPSRIFPDPPPRLKLDQRRRLNNKKLNHL